MPASSVDHDARLPRGPLLALLLAAVALAPGCDRGAPPGMTSLSATEVPSPVAVPTAAPTPVPTVRAAAPDPLGRVDATRIVVSSWRYAGDDQDGAFPWAVRFQDPRVRVVVPAPDGTRAVWRAEGAGAYRLYLGRPDGGGAAPLPFGRDGYQPAWSPDGRRLLFTAVDWSRKERYLMVGEPETGRVLKAFDAGLDAGLGPLAAWSPDGGKIVFVYHGRPWIMNADGIGRSLLDAPVGPFDRLEGIAWSSDGTRLAFRFRDSAQRLVLLLAPRPQNNI